MKMKLCSYIVCQDTGLGGTKSVLGCLYARRLHAESSRYQAWYRKLDRRISWEETRSQISIRHGNFRDPWFGWILHRSAVRGEEAESARLLARALRWQFLQPELRRHLGSASQQVSPRRKFEEARYKACARIYRRTLLVSRTVSWYCPCQIHASDRRTQRESESWSSSCHRLLHVGLERVWTGSRRCSQWQSRHVGLASLFRQRARAWLPMLEERNKYGFSRNI